MIGHGMLLMHPCLHGLPKLAYLLIICTLLTHAPKSVPCGAQTYFRLSTITNCKNVIQTIDNVLKVFDQAEAAHRVTYR